jgi:Protein of unknown function (DUF1566)
MQAMEIRMAGSVKEITLGNDMGEIVVKANGASVEIHADGSLDTFTDEAVKTHPASGDTASGPTPGDAMPDGTIYAGISPESHKPMYTTPCDAPGTYTFNEAAKYASRLDAHGYHDFHAPTRGELNVLWKNRDKGKLAGTFNVTGSYPAVWYWSSSPDDFTSGWAQRFSDGSQLNYFRFYASSLRCVR